MTNDFKMKEKYIFDSRTYSSVDEFFESVVKEEMNGESLPPKHLGDIEIDSTTIVDVKSTNVDKKFHMPNLASQKKLFDWLKEEQNTLMYLFIFYRKEGLNLFIEKWEYCHIEEIDPECLVVQAQGLGALQIKDIKQLKFINKIPRKKWLNILKNMVQLYLMKEEIKIKKTRAMYEQI
jgi:hypothetical protein|tara:strand:- start:165 stop:698 length:534 start_codon:yes stop_codon:yes gene_type:complete